VVVGEAPLPERAIHEIRCELTWYHFRACPVCASRENLSTKCRNATLGLKRNRRYRYAQLIVIFPMS